MKFQKITTVILLFLVISINYSFSENDLTKNKLIGRILECKEIKYKVKKINGKEFRTDSTIIITRYDTLGNYIFFNSNTITNKYNKYNDITQCNYYDSKGLSSIALNIYDNNRNIVEVQYLDNLNKLKSKKVLTYDVNNNKIKEVSYYMQSNNLVETGTEIFTYKFLKSGKIVKHTHETIETSYYYDINNYLAQVISKDLYSDENFTKTKNIYNKQNQIVETQIIECGKNGNEKLIEKFKYNFNDTGNISKEYNYNESSDMIYFTIYSYTFY